MKKLGKLVGRFFRTADGGGMDESTEASIDFLRLKVAINSFKHLLLGDLHEPRKAQTDSVFEAIGCLSEEALFSERTWQSWFSVAPRSPKIEKIKVMDRWVTAALSPPNTNCDFQNGFFRRGFFSEMVHGGLVHGLLAPSKSKHRLHTLTTRANDYEPISSLHLHLDAIEVDALCDGFGDVPWEVVKAIAAQRILELLAEKWLPRHGSIYTTFASRQSLEWDAAGAADRAKILEAYARFAPNLFDREMENGAIPDWSRAGIDSDVLPLHIYKMLFSLAADAEFLVADRLAAWSLDIATAALAMHAFAWSDRYTTFGGSRVTDEILFWAAFVEVLYETEALEPDSRQLCAAMGRCDAEWGLASFAVFQSARESYVNELDKNGLSAKEVFSVAMQATEVHGLIYVA
ncbi:MAG: hypothetical protein WAZ34_00660 [Rhodocyclaceae bacterium]